MDNNVFKSLGLNQALLANLTQEGYEKPTPIQIEAIPALLAGRDCLGLAQTGTGKTAAFALPLIQRLLENPTKPVPKTARILTIAPTRELAAQIDTFFGLYGRGLGLSRSCVFGGVGSLPQERALLRGVHILTATPGRLLDLIDRGHVNLGKIEAIVLDEADRMFDMGFIRDIKRIVSLLPKDRQTVMFSATMPVEIAAFADTLLRDPIRATVASKQPTADKIDQKVLFVAKADKRRLLSAILKEDGFTKVLVFTRTKHGANRLVQQLALDGIAADAIHSNKSQNQRLRAMNAFRGGETAVLIATDLAARGIDVDDVELVVNFDLPNESETYVHRIGRTARAGADGIAISFCDADERILLRDIERLIGFRVPVELDHPFRLEIEPLRDEPKPIGKRHLRPPRQPQPPRPFQSGQSARHEGRRGDPRSPNSGRPFHDHRGNDKAPEDGVASFFAAEARKRRDMTGENRRPGMFRRHKTRQPPQNE